MSRHQQRAATRNGTKQHAFEPARPGEALMPRILVLEDEPLIALALEDWLAELQCDTMGPAASAQVALGLIESAPPDAAILDVSLRDGDSFAVAAALSARNVPFAFATGHGPASIDARFRDVPILAKPFQLDAVRATLASLLGTPIG
jgi:CheY-like chemotaxis protein